MDCVLDFQIQINPHTLHRKLDSITRLGLGFKKQF